MITSNYMISYFSFIFDQKSTFYCNINPEYVFNFCLEIMMTTTIMYFFTDFNPYFGTDYGICSVVKPQLAFNEELDNVPYWKKIFGKYNWNISKGAEVGKANGLSMLLDAETFDYTFHLKAGEGFKIAVHHHLDQPIMSIKELDISPGSVFQVKGHQRTSSQTPIQNPISIPCP